MEHKLITGGEQFLPFARNRIKALQATGLPYASQRFEIEGISVGVRITPGHEYISLSGVDVVGIASYRERRVDLDGSRRTLGKGFSLLDSISGIGPAKTGLLAPNGLRSYVYELGRLVFKKLVGGQVQELADEPLIEIPGDDLSLYGNASRFVATTCSRLPAIVMTPPIGDMAGNPELLAYNNYKLLWLTKNSAGGYEKNQLVLSAANGASGKKSSTHAVVATKQDIYTLYVESSSSINSVLLKTAQAGERFVVASSETLAPGEAIKYGLLLAPNHNSKKCNIYVMSFVYGSGVNYTKELKLYTYGTTLEVSTLFRASLPWATTDWMVEYAVDPSFSMQMMDRVFTYDFFGYEVAQVGIGVADMDKHICLTKLSGDPFAAIFTYKPSVDATPAIHKITIAPNIYSSAYISDGKLYGETLAGRILCFSLKELNPANNTEVKQIDYAGPDILGALISNK